MYCVSLLSDGAVESRLARKMRNAQRSSSSECIALTAHKQLSLTFSHRVRSSCLPLNSQQWGRGVVLLFRKHRKAVITL